MWFLLFFCFGLGITILIHEWIHWLVAKILDYSPKIQWRFFVPSVQYENKNNHFHNLLIASSAPLLLLLIGLVLPGESIVRVASSFCLKLIFQTLL